MFNSKKYFREFRNNDTDISVNKIELVTLSRIHDLAAINIQYIFMSVQY